MTRDRVKGPLAALIRSVLSRVDYFAFYAAKVVAQSADLSTVDLVPDDTKLPGLQAIPVRLGMPGCAVQVAAGARVLLGFENGDPSRPFAALWGTSGLTLIKLAGGGAAAARNGDSVKVTLTAADITQILAPPGTAGGACSGGPITLTGNITAGSAKVQVG